ncbi:1-phosphofructokinase family hexose kinase [Eubacterium multiforme]|uniref:Tagatose-6-phosphate kinase n=1 Tax=Eubacterium multiforme TaxID=83339 RepID=A0ABT9UQ54_9FIRM|nr:1-phosphofructokinase family hexose kinase [Eubacterium multiforme]MDQ0148780.1 tagatose 6-phosphate kinase [Eubacterium multiforme]
MILVLNLNASIDKKYKIKNIEKGTVMRASSVHNTAGGKGLHVANVATILGEDTLATGFLGGTTGDFIKEKLSEMNIKNDFVSIKNATRECLAFITEDLEQTEVLEPGPELIDGELEKFLEKYKMLLKDASVVVASGSVPRNLSKDIYKKLIEIAKENNKKFLLDTSGELLIKGIEGKPFFIKPNKDEIEDIMGRKVETTEDILKEIDEFHKKGIEFVVISLGKDGSIAGYKGEKYRVRVPKVKAVNPVGSGDAFVGGIATGIERGYNIEKILAFAAACGTSNALEEETGVVNKDTVNKLMEEIEVTKL